MHSIAKECVDTDTFISTEIVDRCIDDIMAKISYALASVVEIRDMDTRTMRLGELTQEAINEFKFILTVRDRGLTALMLQNKDLRTETQAAYAELEKGAIERQTMHAHLFELQTRYKNAESTNQAFHVFNMQLENEKTLARAAFDALEEKYNELLRAQPTAPIAQRVSSRSGKR